MREGLERSLAGRLVTAAAASASARIAGSFFGARPSVLTATISATVRRPSAATQRATAFAFFRVRFLSDA